ncbi:hypothetical protein FACS1894190_11550 [Spirochaetia bacterium]|nr:hypothetical protein FACS1894190_11550 [Spirochaetia bacterium]
MKERSWLKLKYKGLSIFFMVISTAFCFAADEVGQEIGNVLFLPNKPVPINTGQIEALRTTFGKSSNNNSKIRIEGYTAAVDNSISDNDLSLARAEEVKSKLIALGIIGGKSEVEVKGLGATHRWGNNRYENTRAPNRRAVIYLLPDELPSVVSTPPETSTPVTSSENSDTPIPSTPSQSSSPVTFTPQVLPSSNSVSSFPWWIIIIALGVVGLIIFLILKKKKPEEKENLNKKETTPVNLKKEDTRIVPPATKINLQKDEIKLNTSGSTKINLQKSKEANSSGTTKINLQKD